MNSKDLCLMWAVLSPSFLRSAYLEDWVTGYPVEGWMWGFPALHSAGVADGIWKERKEMGGTKGPPELHSLYPVNALRIHIGRF